MTPSQFTAEVERIIERRLLIGVGQTPEILALYDRVVMDERERIARLASKLALEDRRGA